MERIRVTIWNEFVHERENREVGQIYPDGIHAALAAGLQPRAELQTRTSVLQDPDQGLGQEILDGTDVLVYWGHAAHDAIREETVQRIQQRVLDGMGFVPLHSAHWSKIFKRLMGTTCALRYREAGERERVWNVNPGHAIAEGIGDYIELPESEMYGEPFGIPMPDEQVFISWFQGGEVFRGGIAGSEGAAGSFTSARDTKRTRFIITRRFNVSSPTRLNGRDHKGDVRGFHCMSRQRVHRKRSKRGGRSCTIPKAGCCNAQSNRGATSLRLSPKELMRTAD